jgi:tRNA pseudouridine55 synthase
MRCGKGVYVRSLARDLAFALGTEGHVAALRRIRVGRFDEAESTRLDVLEEMAHKGAASEALLPVQTALDDIPALAVTEEEAFQLKQGRSIVLLPRQAQELKGSCDRRRQSRKIPALARFQPHPVNGAT